MRRPVVHQAKWLFLGLLKTTASALATTASGGSKNSMMMYATAAATTTTILQQPSPLSQPHVTELPSVQRANKSQHDAVAGNHQLIQLRLARAADVSSIASCNVETLPENYNDQFYLHHLSEWPDLAIVAVVEKKQQQQSSSEASQQQQRPLHSNYEPQNRLARHFQTRFSFLPPPLNKPSAAAAEKASSASSSCTVVAYLLGKVCPQQQQYLHHNAAERLLINDRYDDYDSRSSDPVMVGHVSSLAVLSDFRRRGLADAMLEQFHAHLKQQHGGGATVASTGLHVRCSNTAAVQLYEKAGYTPAVSIPAYYEDGEDAYYMQKMLSSSATDFPGTNLLRDTSQFQLPRVVGVVLDENYCDDDDIPELLSGSL